MKIVMPAALLWLLAIAASLADESPASLLFAGLAGQWAGSGTVNEMAADMRMTWDVVLDGRFQRLTLDNRRTGADGQERHFTAQAFYRTHDDGSISGNWFDSRGISLPLTGTVDEAGVLTILWGNDKTERGRSSYRLTPEGLEVTDEVLTSPGEWRTFGRTHLGRLR